MDPYEVMCGTGMHLACASIAGMPRSITFPVAVTEPLSPGHPRRGLYVPIFVRASYITLRGVVYCNCNGTGMDRTAEAAEWCNHKTS